MILVGGPTFSPVLRKMLEEQICKPDTSADPMTVVSTGAALYASTIDISEDIRDQTRDQTKIQLDISNEASTVELEQYVPIKILADKTEGTIPDKIFVEVVRGDKAWSSGKVEINTIGDLIEIQLNEGKTNTFDVILYDEKGNIIEGEPNSFNVIQGAKISSATLPYNIGIEIKDVLTEKIIFRTIRGLERNQSIPTVGTRNGLKTQKDIRPGMDSDFIKIPIYEGGHESDGTRAIFNEHVSDIIISGADLPALLPKNSDVDLTINIDRSEEITVRAYFPHLDYDTEIKAKSIKSSIETSWIDNELRKTQGSIIELKQSSSSNNIELQKIEVEVDKLRNQFESNKNDTDNKHEILATLRSHLKVIDELIDSTEWPNLEEEIKEAFYKLEDANKDLGDEKTSETVEQIRTKLESVIKSKDIRVGKALLNNINQLYIQLTMIYQLIFFIREYNENFRSYNWQDSSKARSLINEGLQTIGENPEVNKLHLIFKSLYDLLPPDERPSGDDSVLVG